MKKLVLCCTILAFLGFSCKSGNKQQLADAQNVNQIEGKTLQVNPADTHIEWFGHKPGGGHHGTIALKSGEIVVNKDQLLGGKFVIDMATIVNLDLTTQSMNEMLISHLKSPDFFDVEKYPEGKFEITSVDKIDNENIKIHGNLTLKEVTKNIDFNAKVAQNGDVYSAQTDTITLDRTIWGVNYGSKNVFKDIKDKFIDDEMRIVIHISAKE